MNILERFAHRLSQDRRLDRIGNRLNRVFERAMTNVNDRQKLEDFLHGKWLGHPLHPVLTDLPIGAFMLGSTLDAVSMVGLGGRHAARTAIGFGLLTALPTAAAGATDWRKTDGAARRVGTAHALLNSGALVCYATSFVFRGGGFPARLAGFAGLGLLSVSGYLGGHLISFHRIGVRHEADGSVPEQATGVFNEAELPEDIPTLAYAEGFPVTLVRHRGAVHALADVCPHLGCSLSEGTVRDGAITCNCHGSTFALTDGSVLRGPSTYPVETFSAAIREGKVHVRRLNTNGVQTATPARGVEYAGKD